MDKFEKAKLCKAPNKAYEIPSEKVQGETVTMVVIILYNNELFEINI